MPGMGRYNKKENRPGGGPGRKGAFIMFDFLKKIKPKAVALDNPTNKMNLNAYFMDEPHRYVRFKHACIGDYHNEHEKVTTTLLSCTCADFKKTGFPCWHMYALAISEGVYDNLFLGHDDLIKQMESLSPTAFAKFGDMLYGGYYEGPHRLSDFGRYKRPIVESGLISVDGDEFFYSENVRKNLYFVIHYIMADDRFRRTRFTAEAWAEMHKEKYI